MTNKQTQQVLLSEEEDLSQALHLYVFKSVREVSRKRISGYHLVWKCLDTEQYRMVVSVQTSLRIFGCTFATISIACLPLLLN